MGGVIVSGKRWRIDVDNAAPYGKIADILHQGNLLITHHDKAFLEVCDIAVFSCQDQFRYLRELCYGHDPPHEGLNGGNEDDWFSALFESVKARETQGGYLLIWGQRGVGWNLMGWIGEDISGGKELEVLFKEGDHLLIGDDTAAVAAFCGQGAEPGRTAAPQTADMYGF